VQAQHSSMSLQLREIRDSSLFLSAFASLEPSLLFFFRFLFLGVSGWEVEISTILVCYLPDLLRVESICSSVRWGATNFIFSATISTGVGARYPSWPPSLSTNLGREPKAPNSYLSSSNGSTASSDPAFGRIPLAGSMVAPTAPNGIFTVNCPYSGLG
jgi:hypothetical protein